MLEKPLCQLSIENNSTIQIEVDPGFVWCFYPCKLKFHFAHFSLNLKQKLSSTIKNVKNWVFASAFFYVVVFFPN